MLFADLESCSYSRIRFNDKLPYHHLAILPCAVFFCPEERTVNKIEISETFV